MGWRIAVTEEGRKDFFSEEKKQKTFRSALVATYGTWPDRAHLCTHIKSQALAA
jgi:hypothetical protein